jgi:hypothetical protein
MCQDYQNRLLETSVLECVFAPSCFYLKALPSGAALRYRPMHLALRSGVPGSTETQLEMSMKSAAIRLLCRFLIASMFAMSFPSAMAGMIGTGQAVAAASTQAERTALINTLSRSDVALQLQSQGVDPEAAKARVSSMTDQEVTTLAGKIDSLPAGASSGAGWAVAIVVVLLVWYFWK